MPRPAALSSSRAQQSPLSCGRAARPTCRRTVPGSRSTGSTSIQPVALLAPPAFAPFVVIDPILGSSSIRSSSRISGPRLQAAQRPRAGDMLYPISSCSLQGASRPPPTLCYTLCYTRCFLTAASFGASKERLRSKALPQGDPRAPHRPAPAAARRGGSQPAIDSVNHRFIRINSSGGSQPSQVAASGVQGSSPGAAACCSGLCPEAQAHVRSAAGTRQPADKFIRIPRRMCWRRDVIPTCGDPAARGSPRAPGSPRGAAAPQQRRAHGAAR